MHCIVCSQTAIQNAIHGQRCNDEGARWTTLIVNTRTAVAAAAPGDRVRINWLGGGMNSAASAQANCVCLCTGSVRCVFKCVRDWQSQVNNISWIASINVLQQRPRRNSNHLSSARTYINHIAHRHFPCLFVFLITIILDFASQWWWCCQEEEHFRARLIQSTAPIKHLAQNIVTAAASVYVCECMCSLCHSIPTDLGE